MAHIIILLHSAGLLNSKDKYFNSKEGSESTEQGANDCGDGNRDGTFELDFDEGLGFCLMDK